MTLVAREVGQYIILVRKTQIVVESIDTNTPLIFTVVCLVAWPLNESEAQIALVLLETSLLFLC